MVAEINCGSEMRLTLLKDKKGVCCVIHVSDMENSLRCQLSSLHSVLSGLRYHFAGDNVLCTLSLAGDCVIVDVQIGSCPCVAGSVLVEEFRGALVQLEQVA